MDLDPAYFFDARGDERMEKQNLRRWTALLDHVQTAFDEGSLPNRVNVLDIGCHTGGLLALTKERLGNRIISIFGIEPLVRLRELAKQRLSDITFFDLLESMPTGSIDLAVSHETLYLIQDLEGWIKELKRVLRPDGGAFIVLGSHGENTAWLRWRKRLYERYGHISYVHNPMEILQTGSYAGFDMEIGPLYQKEHSTLRYTQPEDGWGEFLSAKELFLFHEQWKYLFIFYPKR